MYANILYKKKTLITTTTANEVKQNLRPSRRCECWLSEWVSEWVVNRLCQFQAVRQAGLSYDRKWIHSSIAIMFFFFSLLCFWHTPSAKTCRQLEGKRGRGERETVGDEKSNRNSALAGPHCPLSFVFAQLFDYNDVTPPMDDVIISGPGHVIIN